MYMPQWRLLQLIFFRFLDHYEVHYEKRKPIYDWQFDTAAETGANRNKLDVVDETKGVIICNEEMNLISEGCKRQFLFISMLGCRINF